MEFDELDYDREIREIYQTYPTSEDLLAKAAALCTLGD
jgi:hypothetical protein